jgi:hypothetical protein
MTSLGIAIDIDSPAPKILHMKHRCSCYTYESLVFGYLMNLTR